MNSAVPYQSKIGQSGHAAFAGVDLVIFDFDGVVVDSEIISLTTLRTALSDHGIEMPDDEVRDRFLGRSLESILEYVAERGQAEGTERFAAQWEQALFEQFRAGLKVVPHIVPLLDQLSKAAIRFCIASSGSIRRIDIALEAARLKGCFTHIFSAEFVSRGKPAPDLFQHAAARLGVSPDRCLVIEDSPSGVQAAKAAGMRCVAFVGGAHLAERRQEHAAELKELGADFVVHHFADFLPCAEDGIAVTR